MKSGVWLLAFAGAARAASTSNVLAKNEAADAPIKANTLDSTVPPTQPPTQPRPPHCPPVNVTANEDGRMGCKPSPICDDVDEAGCAEKLDAVCDVHNECRILMKNGKPLIATFKLEQEKDCPAYGEFTAEKMLSCHGVDNPVPPFSYAQECVGHRKCKVWTDQTDGQYNIYSFDKAQQAHWKDKMGSKPALSTPPTPAPCPKQGEVGADGLTGCIPAPACKPNTRCLEPPTGACGLNDNLCYVRMQGGKPAVGKAAKDLNKNECPPLGEFSHEGYMSCDETEEDARYPVAKCKAIGVCKFWFKQGQVAVFSPDQQMAIDSPPQEDGGPPRGDQNAGKENNKPVPQPAVQPAAVESPVPVTPAAESHGPVIPAGKPQASVKPIEKPNEIINPAGKPQPSAEPIEKPHNTIKPAHGPHGTNGTNDTNTATQPATQQVDGPSSQKNASASTKPSEATTNNGPAPLNVTLNTAKNTSANASSHLPHNHLKNKTIASQAGNTHTVILLDLIKSVVAECVANWSCTWREYAQTVSCAQNLACPQRLQACQVVCAGDGSCVEAVQRGNLPVQACQGHRECVAAVAAAAVASVSQQASVPSAPGSLHPQGQGAASAGAAAAVAAHQSVPGAPLGSTNPASSTPAGQPLAALRQAASGCSAPGTASPAVDQHHDRTASPSHVSGQKQGAAAASGAMLRQPPNHVAPNNQPSAQNPSSSSPSPLGRQGSSSQSHGRTGAAPPHHEFKTSKAPFNSTGAAMSRPGSHSRLGSSPSPPHGQGTSVPSAFRATPSASGAPRPRQSSPVNNNPGAVSSAAKVAGSALASLVALGAFLIL